MNFTHLHLHSEFSLQDSTIKIPKLVQKIKASGMTACALTDHGALFGVIKFYKECKAANIKPILGVEAYVSTGKMDERKRTKKHYHHLILLAKNNIGYQNLLKLCSLAYTEGFYYKPRIDREVLRQHSEGLIASSACLGGEMAMLLAQGDVQRATTILGEYKEIFNGQFYLEVQNHGIPLQAKVNDAIYDLGHRHAMPIIATQDAHFLNREDYEAHKILKAINFGTTVDKLNHFYTHEHYVKTPEEMNELFGHHPECLQNTMVIADQCDVTIELGVPHFPDFPIPQDKTINEVLDEKTYEGFQKVLPAKADDLTYQNRLRSELLTIKKLGFQAYFLIVADFMNWARGNECGPGPGRGSAAGSLVTYVLGITEVDPIPHGLYFERFLNPERISAPDIDSDFITSKRESVLNYVKDKYGHDCVANIITFGEMKSRMCIRDVGRALGIPLETVDQIAKLIPEQVDMTLEIAIKDSPVLQEKMENPATKDLMKYALILEGTKRHVGKHAAGVVISPGPITNFCALYKDPRTGGITTQLDMHDLEAIGLVKMDFLGLRNLDVIENCIKMLPNKDFKFPETYDDAEALSIFATGNTLGIFQFESAGLRQVLKGFGFSSFHDIVLLNALYRPGPMEFIPDVIEVKHGRKEIVLDFPELAEILAPTYGVPIFQEQLMQISQVLAGFSGADADHYRKAVGKKKADEMKKVYAKFLKGATKKGHDAQKVQAYLDKLANFANYCFNRSHSFSYSIIAFRTAYLKAHYPLEFMAALINSDIHNTGSVIKYLYEALRMKISILFPDINASSAFFICNKKRKELTYGLVAIKGISQILAEKIVEERNACGKFTSLYDFVSRIGAEYLNAGDMTALINAGALDAFGTKKLQTEHLDFVLRTTRQKMLDQKSGQTALFEDTIQDTTVYSGEEWPKEVRLQKEFEALGFYMSGHPVLQYRLQFGAFVDRTLVELTEEQEEFVNGTYILAFVEDVQFKRSQRTQKNYAVLTLSDETGKVEAIAGGKGFDKLQANNPKGKVQLIEIQTVFQNKDLSVFLRKYQDPEDLLLNKEAANVTRLIAYRNSKQDMRVLLSKISDICQEFPGRMPVEIGLLMEDKTLFFSTDFTAEKSYRVAQRLAGIVRE